MTALQPADGNRARQWLLQFADTELGFFEYKDLQVLTAKDAAQGLGVPPNTLRNKLPDLEDGTERIRLTGSDLSDFKRLLPELGCGSRSAVLNLISVEGLFAMALRLRTPRATEFRRWLTHEALPAMAKGQSLTALEDTYNDPTDLLLASMLQARREAREVRVLQRLHGQRLDASEARLDDLDSRVPVRPSVEAGERTLTQVARIVGWTTQSGRPHAWAVGAAAKREAFRAKGLLVVRHILDESGAIREAPVLTREGVKAFLDVDAAFHDDRFDIPWNDRLYQVFRQAPTA